jgi:hypothetical protein
MADSQEEEHVDVIICGCGPTGALLSAYLSRVRVKHVILEREEGITTDPRGIALDEDGIRIVQGVGKYYDLLTDVGKGISVLLIFRHMFSHLLVMGFFRFIDGGRGLHVKPFLQINYNSVRCNKNGIREPRLTSHRLLVEQDTQDLCLTNSLHSRSI